MSAGDVAGRELKVGQQVAYCVAGTTQYMRLALIVKISPKTVELDAKVGSWSTQGVRRSHGSVCIVEVSQ